MRSRLLIVLAALLLMVAGPWQLAQAHEDSEESTETETSTTVEERKKRRQTEFKFKLGAQREKVIANRCEAAQSKLSAVAKNSSQLGANRQKVYDRLVERLNEFVARVEKRELDSTKLKTAITELQAKVDIFVSDFETYHAALDDASEMDCASDPEAFQAALLEARQQRIALREQALGIRKWVRETLKEVFADLKDQLKAKAGDTDESSTETEGTN